MAGTTKLMTPGGGGVNLTPASSIASDVTVSLPSITGTALVADSTGVISGSSGNNVGLGYQSLNSNTGANNTAVGYQAGYNTTTGNGNTFVGYAVNGYGTAASTGDGNTWVGQYLQAATASDGYSVLIGRNLTSKGSNTGFIAPGNGGGGAVYQGNNSASWSTTSDQRIKENVVTVENGLEIISQLRPVTFDYILTQKPDVGFIAQEFQTVLPDQVQTHAASPEEKELVGDDTLFGITPNLIPYLVAAIKELSAKNDALEARLSALEAK